MKDYEPETTANTSTKRTADTLTKDMLDEAVRLMREESAHVPTSIHVGDIITGDVLQSGSLVSHVSETNEELSARKLRTLNEFEAYIQQQQSLARLKRRTDSTKPKFRKSEVRAKNKAARKARKV